MLKNLGNIIRAKLLNILGEEVNPSTDDKLNSLFEDSNENPANAKVKIHDGVHDVKVTSSGRLEVDARIGIGDQSASISAFGLLKIAQESSLSDFRWSTATLTSEFNEYITGLGNYSIVDTSALQISSGAQSSSGIKLSSKSLHYYNPGRGMLYKTSIILLDSGIEGNIREWGLFNEDNGVFIRLNGTVYEFVLKSAGTETVVPASEWDIPITPNPNGHLWYIQFQWLGVGDYFIYYDGQLVHTYHHLGNFQFLSMEDPDLPLSFRNYNITNTTDVKIKSGCSSVVIEGNSIIAGKDFNNIIRDVRVTPEGRLLISQEPPSAPANKTSVIQYELGNVSETDDLEYIIPIGETITINFFSAGAEADSDTGNAIELYYDPLGTGIDMELIDVVYASGNSDQHDLNVEYNGDGIAKIRMRRRRLSGGSKEIYGSWRGYY